MPGLLVVDTSVLVAVERQKLPLDALHEVQPGARLALSAITVSELLHGYHRGRPRARQLARQRFISALLERLEVLSFDLAVAREHGRAWAELAGRGEVIGPHDLIIAATALAHAAPLATLNDREFGKVRTLEVRSMRPYLRP